jgi:hypothetical protein
MIENYKKITLKGKWHQITYEEAFSGLIGQLFLAFVMKYPQTTIIYGILAHNQEQSFRYFIGSEDCGNGEEVVIPEGNYLISFESEEVQDYYSSLQSSSYDFMEMFEGQKRYNLIPTKIEKFQYNEHHLVLSEILIPIKGLKDIA